MQRQGLRFLFLVVIPALACAGNAVKPSVPARPLVVTITSTPETLAPEEAVTLTVEAKNVSATKIVFGHGSSSCQLGAVVRLEGEDYLLNEMRVCTMDAVSLALGPGEERTESWQWSGEILVDGLPQRLPAGVYELRGIAGESYSAAVPIVVTDSP